MLTLEVKNKIPKLFLITMHHLAYTTFWWVSHTHLSEQSPLLTFFLQVNKEVMKTNRRLDDTHPVTVRLIMLFNGTESLLPSLI